MASDEAPRNELERCLMAAQDGQMSPDDMPEALMASQVFMPVRDDDKIGGFQRSTKALPLSLTAEDGTPVLILFSSPERAKPFLQAYPGYEGGC